jgi:hypothetical protein
MSTNIEKLDAQKALFVGTHVIIDSSTRTESSIPLLIYPPEDATIHQQMRIMEVSGVLDFWNRPEEDGYTEADGEPI